MLRLFQEWSVISALLWTCTSFPQLAVEPEPWPKEKTIFSDQPTIYGRPNETRDGTPPSELALNWPKACNVDDLCRQSVFTPKVDLVPDKWNYVLCDPCVTAIWLPLSYAQNATKMNETLYLDCLGTLNHLVTLVNENPNSIRIGYNLKQFPSDPDFQDNAMPNTRSLFPTALTGMAIDPSLPSYEIFG